MMGMLIKGFPRIFPRKAVSEISAGYVVLRAPHFPPPPLFFYFVIFTF